MVQLISMRRLGLAAVAAIAAESCAVGLMATAAWLIARAAQQPTIAALGIAIVGVRAFAIFRGVFRYVERLTGHDVALRAVAELRTRVYRACQRRPGRRDTGDGLSRMVSDVDSVQDLLLRCVLPAVVAAAIGAASVAGCLLLLPGAGLLLAAGLLVAGVAVPAAAAYAARRLGTRLAAARARLAAAGLDLVDGAWELAAFGATGSALARAGGQAARLARLERRGALVSGASTAAGVVVQGLTVVAVILVAVTSGVEEVVVAVLGLTALAAFEAVLPLGDAAQRFTELRAPLARVRELLDVPPAPARRPWSAGGLVPDRIVLRNVRVTYDSPALDGIDLRIERGRSVAVVGASGAGKSTLLGVIGGQVEPDGGVVALPDARGLTQDAHVFHTSIRANLLLARPDASDARLAAAARDARLLDWVESLPDGWDTVVGEGGRSLSGGQRQRLLLARALLADPPVLLLDEPTEGLDREMADDVLRTVLAARRGRTTVVVTHRLACLGQFDEVIVMDRGRIVERGTHDRLVTGSGAYRDLWAAERLASES
jgi:ATP-binding cassette subfamily C protein CydC